jgi:sigma-54-specific transcriptional regulator
VFHSVEGTRVRIAFDRSRENQVRAAPLLGVTRKTLRTLLKR